MLIGRLRSEVIAVNTRAALARRLSPAVGRIGRSGRIPATSSDDIDGPSLMMLRQDFDRQHLKLEGNAVRTKLVKSSRTGELTAPLGLSVPKGDACRIRIDVYAKGRARRVARRTLSVSPVE